MTTVTERSRISPQGSTPCVVPIAALEEAALEIMRRAAIDIPDDYKSGIRAMMEQEEEELARFVLQSMLENWEAASDDRRAMCADTGLPRYFVKSGNRAFPEGGFCNLERALRQATATATREVPLRPNRVHPLTRQDNNNNVGIGAPEIDYSFEPDADWIELTTVHKGGLFGSDYRMLFPGDGVDGIKRFLLDVLVQFGRRGLACQPAIVGVGLGGSKDVAMSLGKQAACLRTVGSKNPDPEIAQLEAELKELGNSIGMGPMGFVGKSMVVQCNVEVAYTHTGGMPMSVHTFCLSSRRATARVHADGRIEYRSDPMWFTDHMRREGVQ
jgi:L(+)-tartrate dehydratase alpha subunit